jgi:hypothetical protein
MPASAWSEGRPRLGNPVRRYKVVRHGRWRIWDDEIDDWMGYRDHGFGGREPLYTYFAHGWNREWKARLVCRLLNEAS